jgi:hypothetical protein
MCEKERGSDTMQGAGQRGCSMRAMDSDLAEVSPGKGAELGEAGRRVCWLELELGLQQRGVGHGEEEEPAGWKMSRALQGGKQGRHGRGGAELLSCRERALMGRRAPCCTGAERHGEELSSLLAVVGTREEDGMGSGG